VLTKEYATNQNGTQPCATPRKVLGMLLVVHAQRSRQALSLPLSDTLGHAEIPDAEADPWPWPPTCVFPSTVIPGIADTLDGRM
jgi:hypothetical protein